MTTRAILAAPGLLLITGRAGGAPTWLRMAEPPPPPDPSTYVVNLIGSGQSLATYMRVDGGYADEIRLAAYLCGVTAGAELGRNATQSPTAYTTKGGTGLGGTGPGYDAAFVSYEDGDPPTLVRGVAGLAWDALAQSLTSEQRAAISAIEWDHGQSDSNYLDRDIKDAYTTSLRRWCELMRESLGRTAASLPIIMWSATPYSSADIGHIVYREVVAELAADPTMHVLYVPQTSDTDERYPGDAHISPASSRVLGRRGAYLLATRLRQMGLTADSTTPPLTTPRMGPRVASARLVAPAVVRVTIQHEAGTDLRLPGTAAAGAGWTAFDGPLRRDAIAAARVSATEIDVTFGAALEADAPDRVIYYVYGKTKLLAGNAVTDNWADSEQAATINAALGDGFAADWPVQTTVYGVGIG